MTEFAKAVTRVLARSGKKKIKQDVVDAVEASSLPEELQTFRAYLKKHGIEVVDD